jgi:hypothetical protein
MLSAITAQLAPDRSASLARSALPGSPVRAGTAAIPASRRSPGAARRVAATALRRSADRLAPVIE